MALKVASLVCAEGIIWSTGATILDGFSEADFMFSLAKRLPSAGITAEQLDRISIFDRESTNTLGSMTVGAKLVQERFGKEQTMLHLITSANHAPRVARDAIIAFQEYPNVLLSVVPSHTSYGDKRVSDVVIHELGCSPNVVQN